MAVVMDKLHVSHMTLHNVPENAGVHIAGFGYPASPSLIIPRSHENTQ
jgi:hypothetical protein